MSRTVWRRITTMQFYRSNHCKIGWGAYMITLDCGHQIGRKKSECKTKTIDSRMRCWQCELGGKEIHG